MSRIASKGNLIKESDEMSLNKNLLKDNTNQTQKQKQTVRKTVVNRVTKPHQDKYTQVMNMIRRFSIYEKTNTESAGEPPIKKCVQEKFK